MIRAAVVTVGVLAAVIFELSAPVKVPSQQRCVRGGPR